MNQLIHNTFNIVVNYAYIGRKYNVQWNGKNEWKNLKKDFLIQSNNLQWNPNLQNNQMILFRNKLINELHEYVTINGKQEIVDFNHFLIQCIRIPYKYECSIIRILQIAFNIGQLKVDQKYIKKEIIDEFYELKLDKIETYVNLF